MGVLGAVPRAEPAWGVHGPLWTLWLLFLGEVCTDTALGERGCASLPKEIRGVMERRAQGLGSRGLAQGAPGLPGPATDTVMCLAEALLPPHVFFYAFSWHFGSGK